MGHLLKRVLSSLFLLSLIFSAQSEDKTFPELLHLNVLSYQTEVVVTEEDEEIFAFATEYYDATQLAKGRIDTNVLGTKISIIYDNETDQIISFTPSGCEVWDTADSEYDYEPLFYGWLNKDPLIIGPTAPLWLAHNNRNKVRYLEGEREIRNIGCDAFAYDFLGDRDNVTFKFYFAKEDWKTPYFVEGVRVPIRIEVRGLSSKDSEKADQWETINQLTDFAYFRPDVKNYQIFQPPEGLGCKLKKTPVEITMPKMPKKFKYTAEVVDLLQDSAVQDITYEQVWYDSVEKLARLDRFTKMRYISQLSDFNSGVTYTNVDGQTCDITSLRNSFFEGYDGQMIGHLKEPGEVLGLDGTFYYLGKKAIRSIWCDVFESVRSNVTFMGKSLVQLIITVYYSNEFYEVNVEGETNTRVPVFYAVKGWGADDTKENAGAEIVINRHYNIFGFDDAIYPDMYASFRLGRCFPSLNDKSYFILIMSVSDKLAAIMESQNTVVLERLRGRILQFAKVSNIRIPLLRADYKTTGVYVTGLMLDRPPAIKQFWLEFEGDRSTNDPNLKVVPYADTKEKCAYSCVDAGFDCFGFYFCNEACFLKSKDILEPDDGKDNFDFGQTCQEWLRAEKNSKNEPYLADALNSLENAVIDSLVNITVTLEGDESTVAIVSDIVIGDGPYTGNDDKPYDMVISFAKLDPNDETTEQLSYIDNLNDCYSACKHSEDIDCSSFSFCADAENKQCSISSVLIRDRKTNPDNTIDDKDCYVYSMKYLDYFDAYPGRVPLISGDDEYKNVRKVEDCAKTCRQVKGLTCRSFNYCQHTHSCTLYKKHVLDFGPGHITIDKKATCVHYAARYAADYRDNGYQLIDDESDVRNELSLEECAKVCSEELKDSCQSFNYCPKSGPYMTDSSCALSTYTYTTEPKSKKGKTKPPCKHYEKKDNVDDWGRTPKNSLVTSGYTSGGFAALVIGMLVLGLTLGAVGFVVYSYYRSKSSSDGMSVRFTKGNL